MDVICFFEFLASLDCTESQSNLGETADEELTYHVGQLRFRYQALRFSTDELLFQLYDFRTCWFFDL